MSSRLPREILVCPDCRVALAAAPLKCPRCESVFESRAGSLCLWPPTRREKIERDLAAFSAPHAGLRQNSFLQALVPPNPICDPLEPARSTRLRDALKSGIVVNLGAKSARWGEHVLNIDLTAPREGSLDALADIHRLPFADASLDAVLCTYVLEHVADARACFAEIARVLKPGGQVFVSVPFLFPTHPDPLDHARWTLQGLRAEFLGFDEIEAGNAGGPFSTLAAVAPTAIGSMFSSFVPYNATRFVFGWLHWPLKFLDIFAARSSRAYMAAPAFYYWGRKR